MPQAGSWRVVAEVAAVGSGLNGARPKLLRRLGRSEVAVIVVEPCARLARFGVESLAAARRPGSPDRGCG